VGSAAEVNNTSDQELEMIRLQYESFLEGHLAEMQASFARWEEQRRVLWRWQQVACYIVWAVAAVDLAIAIRKWFFT